MPPSQSDAFTKALGQALERLKSRERFSGDLRVWLIARGYAETTIEDVLGHLRKRGLQSDERAASALVKRRSGKHAVGPERLRAEMEAQGALEETVGAALDSQVNQAEASAQALLSRKSWKDRAQACRFLSSRGFDAEAIESALDIAFGEDSPNGDGQFG